MAVKKTQMYRRQLDGTETNLNPLTESQYVLMENGQTVQEILSDRDSDKYTPVITNSSSTFKVGQGDNVDLSSSMKEGAYDSCVLKGKTMVNCIQEPSSKDVVLPYEFADGQYVTINDTKESGALGVELKGQTLVNLVPSSVVVSGGRKLHKDDGSGQIVYTYKPKVPLKPNTVYTCFVWLKDVVNPNSVPLNCSMSNRDFYARPMTNGLNIAVGTTKSELGGENCNIRIANADVIAGARGVLLDAVVVEGDYSSIEINPFYGMTSCKMPILHTNGKNLLPYNEMLVSPFTSATPYITKNVATFPFTLGVNGRGVGIKFKVEPNTTYTLSSNVVIPNTVVGVAFYKNESDTTNHNSKLGIAFSTNIEESTKTFTTPNECNWIVCGMYILYTYEQSGGTVVISEMPKLQLEKNTQATSYEPHKSSILSLPEEVVLRSLPNGVCDTFNTRTGVYTQRIKEVSTNDVIDYTTWGEASGLNTTNNIAFYYAENSIKTVSGGGDGLGVIISDSLSYTNRNSLLQDVEGVASSNNNIIFKISKSKLPSSLTLNNFKAWLQVNPITIQYELKTPIITKINLPSTLKSWNTTTHIYSEIPENTLYPILSHSNPTYPVILKPSTKYSIVANSYSNSHTNSAINFNLGGATASTTVGNRVTTITTPSTLSNELLTMSGRGNKLNNVMVIEGDVAGDEPYFEGMCDCKSPILSNVGKNLWDIDKLSDAVCTNKTNDSFVLKSWASTVLTNQQIREILKPNTKYTMRAKFRLLKGSSLPSYSQAIQFLLYAPNETSTNVSFFLAGSTHTIGEEYEVTNTFTTPSDFTTKILLGYSKRYANDSTWELGEVEFTDVQLEEMSQATEYEPHKSNTTTFDQKDGKTIVLRSLPNGVCDTLNVETGEYVQRIGDYTVNGTETSWFTYIDTTGVNNNYLNQTSCAFGFHLTGKVKGNGILCDKLPTRSIGWWASGNTGEGICGIDNDNRIFLRVKNEKTGVLYTDNVSTALGKAKAYFTNNPVTVQYQLETPIVTTIDVQGFPYAYTSGHVQLSSGHSGQSLTPKVEYSLSANKTGQIDSNTRQVIRQQNKLDDFEAMMLTSMVQSAYDKAILQFDYEMQMMSLGGE